LSWGRPSVAHTQNNSVDSTILTASANNNNNNNTNSSINDSTSAAISTVNAPPTEIVSTETSEQYPGPNSELNFPQFQYTTEITIAEETVSSSSSSPSNLSISKEEQILSSQNTSVSIENSSCSINEKPSESQKQLPTDAQSLSQCEQPETKSETDLQEDSCSSPSNAKTSKKRKKSAESTTRSQKCRLAESGNKPLEKEEKDNQ